MQRTQHACDMTTVQSTPEPQTINFTTHEAVPPIYATGATFDHYEIAVTGNSSTSVLTSATLNGVTSTAITYGGVVDTGFSSTFLYLVTFPGGQEGLASSIVTGSVTWDGTQTFTNAIELRRYYLPSPSKELVYFLEANNSVSPRLTYVVAMDPIGGDQTQSPAVTPPGGSTSANSWGSLGSDGRCYVGFDAPNGTSPNPVQFNWASIDSALATPWVTHSVTGPINDSTTAGGIVQYGNYVYTLVETYPASGAAYIQVVRALLDGSAPFEVVGPKFYFGQVADNESDAEALVLIGDALYLTQESAYVSRFDLIANTWSTPLQAPLDNVNYTVDIDLDAVTGTLTESDIYGYGFDDQAATTYGTYRPLQGVATSVKGLAFYHWKKGVSTPTELFRFNSTENYSGGAYSKGNYVYFAFHFTFRAGTSTQTPDRNWQIVRFDISAGTYAYCAVFTSIETGYFMLTGAYAGSPGGWVLGRIETH